MKLRKWQEGSLRSFELVCTSGERVALEEHVAAMPEYTGPFAAARRVTYIWSYIKEQTGIQPPWGQGIAVKEET